MAALRSKASTNTIGGPAVPSDWANVYEAMFNITHNKASLHITQYESTLKQLPNGLDSCSYLVAGLEDKQKRLANGFVADTDTQQAVTARDMLRARAVQQLQQDLATAAAIEHAHGATSLSACADEFRSLPPKLERLATANYKPAKTTQQVRAACKESCEAVAAWRTRHDTTAATAATDAALDALWAAVGASKGAVCSVTDDIIDAVGVALDTEYELLTDTNPMRDFPTAILAGVAGLLFNCSHKAVAFLQKLDSCFDWASDALTKYQYAQSLQYPPNVELLQSLQDQLHSADDIIGQLQVDIATNIKSRKPIAELQAKLKVNNRN
jgi:hypothetical protein